MGNFLTSRFHIEIFVCTVSVTMTLDYNQLITLLMESWSVHDLSVCPLVPIMGLDTSLEKALRAITSVGPSR
jgi:hypothetical protein